jgi:hypothetical protein
VGSLLSNYWTDFIGRFDGPLKPLQALLTATVLAVIPYAVLRGPINRLVCMLVSVPDPRDGRCA